MDDISTPDLVEAIVAEIERDGPITFARFMERALYHPDYGYYLAAESPLGRTGDFLTAPEASAYFGITLASAVADCWRRMERPHPFVVREYGSGSGVLAYDVVAGLSDVEPAILDALDYRLIERSAVRRDAALAGMARAGLSRLVRAEPMDDASQPEPVTGIAIANEVADALPVHRLVFREQQWFERYVAWDEGAFVERDGPLSPGASDAPALLVEEGITFVDGARYDVSPAANAWFAAVCQGIGRGYTLIVDYGYLARELYAGHRLGGTVRGYYRHTVTDDPFVRIGRQDLTAHVDFSALVAAGQTEGMRLAGFTTQGAFLASLGLGDRLVALQRDPDATLADYASAQAAVMRLIDPGGLGRFGVLMMARDAPIDPPLLGFSIAPPPF